MRFNTCLLKKPASDRINKKCTIRIDKIWEERLVGTMKALAREPLDKGYLNPTTKFAKVCLKHLTNLE